MQIEGAIPRVTARALNKTGRDVARQAAKPLAAQIGIKQSALAKAIRIAGAKVRDLRVILTPIGIRAVNLIEYGARKAKTGVRATAWGTRKLYTGAFIIKSPTSRKRIVIARRRTPGPKGGKTKAIYGPSIPPEFARPQFNRTLKKLGRARFIFNFNREARSELRKI